MSKLNKDRSLSEQCETAIEQMGKDHLDDRAQRNVFLGLIAIALCSVADDLAVLADKENKNEQKTEKEADK